jgi:hypothetical protein
MEKIKWRVRETKKEGDIIIGYFDNRIAFTIKKLKNNNWVLECDLPNMKKSSNVGWWEEGRKLASDWLDNWKKEGSLNSA